MRTYRGRSVFEGIVIGRLRIYQKERQARRREIEDADAEVERYRSAGTKALEQLEGLYEKALRKVGETDAAIFEAHRMLMADESYHESVEGMVRDSRVNAEYAVACTGEKYARMFEAMEDEAMRARAEDVRDVSQRIIRILRGTEAREPGEESQASAAGEEGVIVVAGELTPSEMMQINKDRVLAVVTAQGSLYSHSAILARTMEIPALVGTAVSLEEDLDGKLGIVDGEKGVLYADPDEAFLAEMAARRDKALEQSRLLQEWRGKETVTLDGRRVLLCANIGGTRELAAALQSGADGIGLFRSEFIYLERDGFPTEEEQLEIYKTVAEAMKGRRVVIRTLDIGADKQCGYFGLEKEENPALGCRAIRICLRRPEIFKTQLRALFRASVSGNIAIMYPMITGVGEVRRIQEIVGEVKEELAARGIPYGEPEQGIMVETPAAVMMSRELAEAVDFFSIGTNDLTQYTLALDRQNAKLEEFYDPRHPAILKMIRMVVENAHRAGIRAGICGELGADSELTGEFLAMGVDELSVPPGSILPLRKIVSETDVGKLLSGEPRR